MVSCAMATLARISATIFPCNIIQIEIPQKRSFVIQSCWSVQALANRWHILSLKHNKQTFHSFYSKSKGMHLMKDYKNFNSIEFSTNFISFHSSKRVNEMNSLSSHPTLYELHQNIRALTSWFLVDFHVMIGIFELKTWLYCLLFALPYESSKPKNAKNTKFKN